MDNKSQLNKLDDMLQLAGADRVISAKSMDMLFRTARNLNIEASDAQKYIIEQAVKNGWTIKLEPREVKDSNNQQNNKQSKNYSELEQLDDMLQLAGADRVISSKSMDMLFRTAKNFNIESSEAQKYIIEQAVKNGWTIKLESPEFKNTNNKKNNKQSKNYSELEQLDDMLQLAGADRVISAKSMEMLFRTAKNLNIESSKAQKYIVEQAVKNGWLIKVETNEPKRQDRANLDYDLNHLHSDKKWENKFLAKTNFYFLIITSLIITIISGWYYYDFQFENAQFSEKIESSEARKIRLKADEVYFETFDYYLSYDLYHQASLLGSAYADAQLAILYSEGLGTAKNIDLAKRYQESSAANFKDVQSNDVHAQFLLGEMAYYIEKDLSKALTFYKVASDQDYSIAQAKLVSFYEQYGNAYKSKEIDILLSSDSDELAGEDESVNIKSDTDISTNTLTLMSCTKSSSLGRRPSFISNANLNKNQEELVLEIYTKIQHEKGGDDSNLNAAGYAFSKGLFRIAIYFMDKSVEQNPSSNVLPAFYFFYALSAFQLYEDGQGLYSLEYTNFWLARSKLFAKYYLEIEGGCGRYSTGAKKIVGQGSDE